MSTAKNAKWASAKTDHSGDVMGYSPTTLPNYNIPNYEQGVKGVQNAGEISTASGLMKVDHLENQTIYFGGAHWISIMGEVCVYDLGLLMFLLTE